MKLAVLKNAEKLIRTLISDETMKINQNARKIEQLADENTMLKRVRTAHITILRDFIKGEERKAPK
jgi:hypothetical protein